MSGFLLRMSSKKGTLKNVFNIFGFSCVCTFGILFDILASAYYKLFYFCHDLIASNSEYYAIFKKKTLKLSLSL